MRVRKFWDDLRSSLWFRPALWVIFLGTLALVLIANDHVLSQSAWGARLNWLFAGEADGARIILGTISGAMVATATLAFSIIIIAVVQTANAYSPRIMRLYLADTTNQHVLGILIGTFLFSMLTLRAVQTSQNTILIPTLAVTVAILLSLLAIAVFVYFIDHVAHSIEVDNVIGLIMRDSVGLLDELFPCNMGQPYPADTPPALPVDPPATVTANHSGYIQYIEPDTLMELSIKRGLIVRLERLTGNYVLAGTPLARIWPAAALDQAVVQSIRQAFQLGTERTLIQDLAFGVRQLSDIALRAISPAINDPSTAVNCLDALATLLIKMARLEPISPYRCDASGNLRVIAPGPNFENMLDLALNQIRQYAARDYACTLRLIEICGEIAYVVQRPADRAALGRHTAMVARLANQNFAEPNDRAEINKRLLAAADTLQLDAQSLML